MTDQTELASAHIPISDGSLRDRLSTRREELRQQKPFDLDVPGYKGVLKARYHSLDYPAIRKIGLRQKDNPNQIESELMIAADTLVNACVCLLEVLPDGSGVRETAFKWNAQTAWELFGIGHDEVPEEATSRVALLRIIPNSTALMLHYAEYDAKSRGVDDEVVRTVEGESEADWVED